MSVNNPITVVQRDTAPKLGGNLDKNGFEILNMVIGTDIQAHDTELDILAALVSAADRLPYFNGAGSATLATFTSLARTLLAGSTSSSMRSTLDITFGTWAPTLTNVANVASFGTQSDWGYLKIGVANAGAMVGAGRLSIDPTAGNVNTEFGMSLPFASNIALFTDIGGVFFAKDSVSLGGAILGDFTNDRANFKYVNTAETAAREFYGIFFALLK